jgi:uncharacterized protein YkwD
MCRQRNVDSKVDVWYKSPPELQHCKNMMQSMCYDA